MIPADLLLFAFPVLILAGYGAGTYFWLRHRWELMAAWKAAAVSLGWTIVEESSPWLTAAILAEAGPFGVRLAPHVRNKVDLGFRVTVACGSGVTLRRESSVTALEKQMSGPDLELGDEAFDRDVYVQGAPEVLRAVLDAETRERIRRLVVGHAGLGPLTVTDAWVQSGNLNAVLLETRLNILGPALPAVLSALLDLARRLARPEYLVPRLAENAQRDPEWRVRLGALRQLVERYPHLAPTGQALALACQDERQEVQLEAALALGGEGKTALLLDIASREWADDGCAARAIAELRSRLPVDLALKILGHALRTRRLECADACIERLGHGGGSAVVEALAKVLAVETGPLAVAAARALGASSDHAAEAPLLEALQRKRPDIPVAAAEALGRVGSATAIPSLKDAAEGSSDGAFRSAARQAITEIQARLGGATPGQLSLAEGEAGQLSLPEASLGSFVDHRLRRVTP